jgi:predicted transcriptional regulator
VRGGGVGQVVPRRSCASVGKSYNEPMTATAKEQVRQLLDEIPDDASLQDIEYRIYLRRKVDQGLEDVRRGRVVEQAEVERRMARWLDD